MNKKQLLKLALLNTRLEEAVNEPFTITIHVDSIGETVEEVKVMLYRDILNTITNEFEPHLIQMAKPSCIGEVVKSNYGGDDIPPIEAKGSIHDWVKKHYPLTEYFDFIYSKKINWENKPHEAIAVRTRFIIPNNTPSYLVMAEHVETFDNSKRKVIITSIIGDECSQTIETISTCTED